MSTRPQTIVQAPREQIASVNNRFLGALLWGGAAWFIWPLDPWWWGFYILSTVCGLTALCLLASAVRLIMRIRKFERDQRAFAEQGRPIKAARLADTDILTNRGVIRDARGR